MKSFVISLRENNSSRRDNIKEQFKNARVMFEFFDAITVSDIDIESQRLGISFDGSTFRDVVKACFLSHVNLWELMLVNKWDYLAIFEDDIYLSPDAALFLDDDEWIPANASFIKLEKFNRYYYNWKEKKQDIKNERFLFNLKEINWGGAGYIISQYTARNILNEFKQRDKFEAIDHELFLTYLNKFGVSYQLEPAICIQDLLFNDFKFSKYPSVVNAIAEVNTQKNNNKLGKIKKELSRLSPTKIYKNLFFKRKVSTFR